MSEKYSDEWVMAEIQRISSNYTKAPKELRAFLFFAIALNVFAVVLNVLVGDWVLAGINLSCALFLWFFPETGSVIRKGRFR